MQYHFEPFCELHASLLSPILIRFHFQLYSSSARDFYIFHLAATPDSHVILQGIPPTVAADLMYLCPTTSIGIFLFLRHCSTSSCFSRVYVTSSSCCGFALAQSRSRWGGGRGGRERPTRQLANPEGVRHQSIN